MAWIDYAEPFFGLTPQQIIALTAYAENRGGGSLGMQSVINVIQNRAINLAQFGEQDIYAATGSVYFAVCLKYEQFSSFNLGNSNRAMLLRLAQPGAYEAQLINDLSLRTADGLVQQLMNSTLNDITGGANYYFATGIKVPIWALTMTYRTTIADQLFYAATPYLSQNPQSYIAPVGNAGSTDPLAPIPNINNATSSQTDSTQAIAVATSATAIKILPLL